MKMKTSMKSWALALATVAGIALPPGASSAGLIGDAVDLTWYFPDTSTVVGTSNVPVGAGVELSCPAGGPGVCAGFAAPATIDLDAYTITIDEPGSPGYNVGSFNGFVFSSLDLTEGAIAGIALNTNISGLTLGNLSFDAHSVTINLAGLGGGNVGGSDYFTISLTPVPEPEIYVMLAAGLGMMGYVARRRKQRLAAA
jgi:hypothetical protein